MKEWVKSEKKLSTESLKKYFESNNDPSLANILRWSNAVNSDIRKWLGTIPPFPNALKAIQMVSLKADLSIVSQTPLEAITREWKRK